MNRPTKKSKTVNTKTVYLMNENCIFAEWKRVLKLRIIGLYPQM